MNQAYDTLKKLGLRVSLDPRVQCLLGLGSMSETSRMDEFSDMDFFLIVDQGAKRSFIDDLDWLVVVPIEYSFRNTVDGYKALFANGVFAEFAVFKPGEMAHIGFTKGNIIYARPNFDETLVEPRLAPKKAPLDVDYCVNEALTNLYVGVLRELRGETSAAMTCIQTHAANHVMELFEVIYPSLSDLDDPYAVERRIEKKYEAAREILRGLKPGYDHNLDAARFALDFLSKHFHPHPAMVKAVAEHLK
ncbi:MAG: hypothetical protein WC399_05175 [Bacilli bacterium]